MSQVRYTDEFKIEAVKQVTEQGHSVADVAQRLGVSSHSLKCEEPHYPKRKKSLCYYQSLIRREAYV